MARKSKWSAVDRKKLLKLVGNGVTEQEIRESLAVSGKAMTAGEFAQQLKMAMVESGKIKQSKAEKKTVKPVEYKVTSTGRLTVPDFAEKTGAAPGAKYTLASPRGKSKAWRLVPVD